MIFFVVALEKAFCWEKHCPLGMDRCKCNLCTFFRDLGWFNSVTIWEDEQNKSFAFQARTLSSLFSKKPGRSQVLTSIQERLSFQIWSCWPWLLYFLSEGNSFLFKNKMTTLLPSEKNILKKCIKKIVSLKTSYDKQEECLFHSFKWKSLMHMLSTICKMYACLKFGRCGKNNIDYFVGFG